MSDSVHTSDDDGGKAYLQRQAVEYQMKIARLQSAGKKIPPGGIIFYNVRTMLQMTGDEMQLFIARELKIPIDCVHLRLVSEDNKIVPHVNLRIPKMWVNALGIKGCNDQDLQAMARMFIDGVVKQANSLFAELVARRMAVFANKINDAG
jgi:hypothetical protein